jgi:hypothetical protein
MLGTRFDIENQLSVAQAFTGAATVSTHSYKKQSAAQDLSIGRRMALLVLPVVAAGAGSTVLIEAIQSADAALGTPDVLASVSIAAASFIKGVEFEVPFPQGTMTKQYLGARVTITGGTTTATMDIYFVPQDENPKYKSFVKINDASV